MYTHIDKLRPLLSSLEVSDRNILYLLLYIDIAIFLSTNNL